MADPTADLLQALISVVGRGPVPEEVLREAIGPAKQQSAYNLCDGTRRQADIVKLLKLDAGNFSRTVARWLELGFIFRIGAGSDAKLRHLYPLPNVKTNVSARASVRGKAKPRRAK